MFSRGNKGKDQLNKQLEPKQEHTTVSQETMSKEDFFAQDEEAKKIYDDIRSLRESIESLKTDETDVVVSKVQEAAKQEELILEDTEEIIAAKQAIIEQAKKDAEEERRRQEEAKARALAKQKAQMEILEAQKRAALIEEAAERKRKEAEEAERKAKAISRKKAIADMEAEIQAKNQQLEREYAEDRDGMATPEEMEAFFGDNKTQNDKSSEEQIKELEEAREALLNAQQQQGKVLGAISQIAEKTTEKLAEEQQQKLTKQQILIKQEQEKLRFLLEAHKHDRIARAEREKYEREIKAQKAKVEKLIKEERADNARKERLARIQKKHDEKLQRAEAKERHKREKKEAAERAKLERERLKQKSIADAEVGGGVVNVKGVQVNTKVKDTIHISLKDLLGFASRQERKEASEEKTRELREEREKRREEAREIVELSMKQKKIDYENSKFGKKMRTFKDFCEEHKKALLFSFSAVIMLAVGVAGVFNYYTAYEYSYNGKPLGLVKEKDDVLRITDMVQSALTEDKNVDVIIDAKDDISFKRVAAFGDVQIDNSEEVLKSLTYMGDLNVKAYGIYINGKRAGAVESKDIAANVMQNIKDRYVSGREGAEIEEAIFIEKVDIRKTNINLREVYSESEMVNILCTSGKKESFHKVVEGETLADIAKLYSMDEKDILDDNPNVDRKKLEVGSNIAIKQNAPILTVKITEMVTYDKKVKHKVEKKKDPEMYEGYSETKQKGENGLSEITSRIILVNGEEIEEVPLVTTVKKKPVTEVIMVGSKERPPSVGSGKYIWPLTNYTLTSNFGSRWGRSHEGIDLGCSVGSDVVAADGGVVTYSGYNGAYGYLIIIDHQNGMETRYAHNSQLLVSQGEKVFQGQHIAESGNSGRSTGPHLHFEIRSGGTPLNPLNKLP